MYVSFFLKKYFIPVFFLLTSNLLFTQEINITEIESILQNNQGNTTNDYQKIIQELNQVLNQYYQKKKSDTTIAENQQLTLNLPLSKKLQFYGDSLDKKLNTIKKIFSKPIKGHFIEESPSLFLAHKTLGMAYENIAEPNLNKALLHYHTASRYRTLKFSKEVMKNPIRQKSLPKNSVELNFIDQFSETENEIVQIQSQIQTKNKNIIRLNDEIYSRNSSESYNELSNQIQKNQVEKDNLNKRLLNLNQNFEEDLKKTYTSYEKKWNQSSSQFLIQLGGLTQKLENYLKEKEKLIEQKRYYNNTINQALDSKSTQLNQFQTYTSLLEQGFKLDNENSQISFTLGEAHQNFLNLERSIYYYEKTLDLEKKKPVLDNLSKFKTHYSLGGLHTSKKNFVDSAYHYEQALALIKTDNNIEEKNICTNKDCKKSILFELGKLHTQKTGNLIRANELLDEFLTVLNQENPSDNIKQAKKIHSQTHSLLYKMFIYKKQREQSKMGEVLVEAELLINQLEELYKNEKKIAKDQKQKINILKQTLKTESNNNKINEYYTLEAIYQEQKSRVAQLKTLQRSIPLVKIYFSLAHYFETIHNIDKAINMYEIAEKKGVQPKEARRKIERLKKKYK